MEHRVAGYVLVSVGCALATAIVTLIAGGGWTLALVLYPISGFGALAMLVAWALLMDRLRSSDGAPEECDPVPHETLAARSSRRDASLRQAPGQG